MTREEAIKIIDCYDIGFYDLSGEKIPADKLAEAFDMAIEALSADAVSREVYDKRIQADEEIINSYRKVFQKSLQTDAVMRDATAEESASVQRYIDSISTEAVQVVRCKDCRHRCKEPIYSKADAHWVIYQIGDCPIICKTVSDDDYCSWGEKREE